MKIITYSDLHLEFGSGWDIPSDIDGDVMILAGDMVTFKDYAPLDRFLQGWRKPVLYVAGNHEYYTQTPMDRENENFRSWLSENHSNVTFLLDESASIDGVHFFCGTMWTNFNNANRQAMSAAQRGMSDFRVIRNDDGTLLTPEDTTVFHESFKEKLLAWFARNLDGPRIVVTHHAPVVNPRTQYMNSPLMPGFNSLDMQDMIAEHQPDLWIYGHTHECDDQEIGKTRIISNQLGYPRHGGSFECAGFDPHGKLIEI